MEKLPKFSKENPIYEPESTPGREMNAEEVLKDMEYDSSRILEGIRNSIENGDYSMVLGIDGGGRIPALTIGKTIQEVYKDLNIDNKLNINFIAGHRNPDDVSYKLEDYFNTKDFQKIQEEQKKILIVEDVIETGNSVKSITEILNEKNINFDVATLSFSEGMMREYSMDPFEQLKKIEEYIDSDITFGSMDEISSVYGTKEMSGVRKNSSDLFSKSLNIYEPPLNPKIPSPTMQEDFNRDIVTYTRKKIYESVKNLKEDFLKLTYHNRKLLKENKEFYESPNVATVLSGEQLYNLLFQGEHEIQEEKFQYKEDGQVFKYFDLGNVFKSANNDKEDFFFPVTKNENEITGVAELQKDPRKENNFWLKHISVNPDFQGKGYGRKLAEEIFDFAKEKEYSLELSFYSQQGEERLKKIVDELIKTKGVKIINGYN